MQIANNLNEYSYSSVILAHKIETNDKVKASARYVRSTKLQIYRWLLKIKLCTGALKLLFAVDGDGKLGYC